MPPNELSRWDGWPRAVPVLVLHAIPSKRVPCSRALFARVGLTAMPGRPEARKGWRRKSQFLGLPTNHQLT
jgi:hypothetical protein